MKHLKKFETCHRLFKFLIDNKNSLPHLRFQREYHRKIPVVLSCWCIWKPTQDVHSHYPPPLQQILKGIVKYNCFSWFETF